MTAEKQNSGFTLVELSIVMIIIGLLIGGILKGQELITNARITSTVAQIRNYSVATLTFYDSYGNYPGDIAAATALVPNCNAGNYCGNGNGDMAVGQKGIETYASDQANTTSMPAVETTYFWKHLALAQLITGDLSPSAPIFTPQWGTSFPSNSLSGGGFTVYWNIPNDYYEATTGFADNRNGLAVRLQNKPYAYGAEWQHTISPALMYKVDAKMDDGLPGSGRVQGVFTGSGCKTDGTRAATYQVNNAAGKCMGLFQLN